MMHAPNEVLDLLESILGIFFYDIRYKERSVYILCDNLVELSCKTKIKQINYKEDVKKMSFYSALKEVQIGEKLRDRLLIRREIRSDMQHQLAGITIDKQQYADAIMDLVALLNHRNLWGKYAFDPAPVWVFCGLRIVKLYSRFGQTRKRKMLEGTLQREIDWDKGTVIDESNILSKTGEVVGESNIPSKMEKSGRELVNLDGSPAGERHPNPYEIIIHVGSPEHWSYLIKEYTERVVSCLDELQIDEL